MDLPDFVELLRRRGWMLVLSVVIALAGAYGVTRVLTPVYEARSSLFVGAVSTSKDVDPAAAQNGLISQGLARSYVEFARSRTTLERAEALLGAELRPEDVHASVVEETQVLRIESAATEAREAASRANAVTEALLARINGGRPAPEARLKLIDRATPPAAPVRPKLGLNLALGGLVGLLLGYGAALAAERLDRRVRDLRRGQAPDAPRVLGEVPRIARRFRRKHALLRNEDPRVAEPFRRLGAGVDYVCRKEGIRSLLVTSPAAEEGKTTVAVGLAVALADSGRRVALVEADFRRPDVRGHFELNGTPGTAETLRAGGRPEGTKPAPNLRVFPAGAVDERAARRLVDSYELGEFLASTRTHFDLVLIDSPPVLPIADTAILAQRADAAIVVARRSKTSLHSLASATARLEELDVNVIGAVLNDAAPRGREYHYAY